MISSRFVFIRCCGNQSERLMGRWNVGIGFCFKGRCRFRSTPRTPRMILHGRQDTRDGSHLEEALHILQDINSTVAEVVLLRHAWAGALHHILPKTPLGALTHLPLHLQVPRAHTRGRTRCECVPRACLSTPRRTLTLSASSPRWTWRGLAASP